MKKTRTLATFIIAIALVAVAALAEQWQSYDMADYGTTASITNSVQGESTLTYALVTYDGASITNTLAIYVTVGGIDYQLGTSTVTGGKYAAIDLVDMQHWNGGILKITTTETNVNVRVRSD